MKYWLVLVLCLIVGCAKEQESSHAKYRLIYDNLGSRPTQYRDVELPTNTRNITEVGNGWYTFECEIAGRTRTFLFARYRTTHGYAVGTITELSN